MLGLKQIDDVDPVALAVDVRTHAGIPASRLVAEVKAGLQQLLDSGFGHEAPFSRFGCSRRRLRGPGCLLVACAGQGPVPSVGGWLLDGGDCRTYPARARSSAAARSGGSGEVNSTSSPVNGWVNPSLALCRNWRSSPWRPECPYCGSPATGCAIA